MNTKAAIGVMWPTAKECSQLLEEAMNRFSTRISRGSVDKLIH